MHLFKLTHTNKPRHMIIFPIQYNVYIYYTFKATLIPPPDCIQFRSKSKEQIQIDCHYLNFI